MTHWDAAGKGEKTTSEGASGYGREEGLARETVSPRGRVRGIFFLNERDLVPTLFSLIDWIGGKKQWI
jgi:hypothetical protein